jgi:hypothetical protein
MIAVLSANESIVHSEVRGRNLFITRPKRTPHVNFLDCRGRNS